MNKSTMSGCISILLSFVFFLNISGCSLFKSNLTEEKKPTTPNVLKEKEEVGIAAKNIGETAETIGKRAEMIDANTTKIEVKATSEDKPNIQTEIQGIREQTQGLRQDQSSLRLTEQKLKDTENKLSQQQEVISNYAKHTENSEQKIIVLQNKIKELESSNAQLLKTMMTWIAVACVVGIGASLAIGFFLKTPAAFMVAGGCIITLGIAVAVSMYLQYIAWVALTILGLGCIGTIVFVINHIKTKDKAVDELVHTGEVVKSYLPSSTREKIFGNKVEPGVAHMIQSDTTINLVKKSRNRAKVTKSFGLAPEAV